MKYIILLVIFLSTLNANPNKLEKVSLQLMWFDQFQFAGYYMAKEKGFYKDELLDVKIKKYKYGMDVTDEVVNAKATFGIGRSALIKDIADGKEAILLSPIFQKSPYTLIALKSSNINNIEDFVGKKVWLIHNTVEDVSIRLILMSNKILGDSVIYEEHSYKLQDLIDGTIDLYAGYASNEPYTLKKKNIPYNVFFQENELFSFYSDILFTSKMEIRDHSKRVERFKRASLKGWKYAFEHIDETIKVIQKKYNSQNKTTEALLYEANALKKLAYVSGKELGDIDESKLQRIYDIYKILGLVNNKIDIKSLYYNKKKFVLNKKEKEYLKSKKEFKVCVMPNELPYSAIEDSVFSGMGADMLKVVEKQIDKPFKLIYTNSWKESLEKVENRECDILPIAEATPSRKKFLNFTKPYYEEPLVIVTDNSKKYIVNIETVLDKEFSIVSGYSFIELLKAKYPNIKLNIVDSREEGFLGVKTGKYYGHIDMIMAAAYYMQNSAMIDLKISGQFKDGVNLSFGIRNDDRILFDILNKASSTIDAKSMKKALRKWIKINYTNDYDYELIKIMAIVTVSIMLVFFYRQYLLNKKNSELKKLQHELMELNKSLETKVEIAVEDIMKKDAYLLHQSRLATLGEMLSMIAHQWKQPLSSISTMQIAIRMAIELDKYDLNDKLQREDFLEFLHEKLDKINVNVQNLSQIISDFSDFYKPNKNSQLMELNRVIVKSCNLIEDTLIANNIALDLDLQSKTVVKLHKNEFMQVVLNIITNAQDQLIDKRIKHPYIKIKTYSEDKYSFVEVRDNAGGIDEKIIKHVFDPYFSTKLEKNGTGLGLYMSSIIIHDYHDAEITATNDEFGAVFVIKIKWERIKDSNKKLP